MADAELWEADMEAEKVKCAAALAKQGAWKPGMYPNKGGVHKLNPPPTIHPPPCLPTPPPTHLSLGRRIPTSRREAAGLKPREGELEDESEDKNNKDEEHKIKLFPACGTYVQVGPYFAS